MYDRYIDGVLNGSSTLDTGIKAAQFYLIGALTDRSSTGNVTGANYFNGQWQAKGNTVEELVAYIGSPPRNSGRFSSVENLRSTPRLETVLMSSGESLYIMDAISSVVLSSQKIPLTEAIFSVKKGAPENVNPLVDDGQKLFPSVTRVFSRGRRLYVFLQAYERGADAMQPLVSFVTLYQDGVKMFETPPQAVSDGMDAHSKAVPLRFDVSLATLTPGRYECQVTVLDSAGQKANFWRAPIVVIP